jgi:hypothetical protein
MGFVSLSCGPSSVPSASEDASLVEVINESKVDSGEDALITFDCSGQYVEFENVRFRCNPELGGKVVVDTASGLAPGI